MQLFLRTRCRTNGNFSGSFKSLKAQLKSYIKLCTKPKSDWKLLLIFTLLNLVANGLFAQSGIEWDRTFGGNRADGCSAAQQTSDGGYIMGGFSSSDASSDKTQGKVGTNPDTFDYWVVKTKADGTKEWDRTVGGNGTDFLKSILQTSDGGFLLAGTSPSDASGDKTANHYGTANAESNKNDFWIVKLAANGDKQWDKTIGGNLGDDVKSMASTSDGGYILGGSSNSDAGANKTQNSKGGRDYWIVKITSNGTVQWDKTIGGNLDDDLASVVQTTDGGYALGGYSASGIGGDKTQASRGNVDYWVVKLTSNGSYQWDKTIGGSAYDELTAFQQTSDGGYIAGGFSESGISGDKVDANKGQEDYWVVKLNQNGAVQWQRNVGGSYSDRLSNLIQVTGGGYLVAGASNGFDGDHTQGSNGANDWWLIKLAADGTTQWDRTIGSNYYEQLMALHQTSDGGFILAGASNSNVNVYKTEEPKNITFISDYWIVKLVPESTNKVLSFSTWLMTFTNSGSLPVAPQSAVLSSGTGTPPLTIKKSPGKPWLTLPPATLGSMSFSIDKSAIGEPGNNGYIVSITVTSPGYARASMLVNLINRSLVLDRISDQSVLANNTLTFVANAVFTPREDPEPQKTFSLLNAPAGAVIGSSTGIFNWVPQVAGTYVFTVKVSTGAGPTLLTDEQQVTVTVLEQTLNESIRINAGGPDLALSGGRVFLSDRYFAGTDRVTSVRGGDIANTTEDNLYRSGRCSPEFSYNIPMENANYKVVLHFAETWFGAPGRGPAGAGKRMFNVDIEGTRKLTDYDIYARAGGAMKAIRDTIIVTVADQKLNINFLAGSADMPRVAAIEVLKLDNIVVLSPIEDSYVRAGNYASENFGSATTLEVKNNSANSGVKRTSYLKFSLNGLSKISYATLRVYGSNVEDNTKTALTVQGVYDDSWTESGITWYNAPSTGSDMSTVSVNNVAKYYELDLGVGPELIGDNVVTYALANLSPQNRKLTFNSRESGINPPQLVIHTNAIITPAARIGAEIPETGLPENLKKSVIFPNPIRKQFTVEISHRHSGNVSFQLVSTAGRSYKIDSPKSTRAGAKVELDITNLSLKTGIYLLKIKSATASEVNKVLITE